MEFFSESIKPGDKYPPKNKTLDELKSEYKAKFKLLHEKEGIELLLLNPIDTIFMGYGFDCISRMKQDFKIDLTLNELDLLKLEKILETYHLGYVDKVFDDEALQEFCKIFSGYIGLIIQNNFGGKWVPQVDKSEDLGPAILLSTQGSDLHFFVINRVKKRITEGLRGNGEDSSILVAYDMIKDKCQPGSISAPYI